MVSGLGHLVHFHNGIENTMVDQIRQVIEKYALSANKGPTVIRIFN